MYFIKTWEDDKDDDAKTIVWNAAKWLELADRLGMEYLRGRCQWVILRDIYKFRDEVKLLNAMESLGEHKVKAAPMLELAAFMIRFTFPQHGDCLWMEQKDVLYFLENLRRAHNRKSA